MTALPLFLAARMLLMIVRALAVSAYSLNLRTPGAWGLSCIRASPPSSQKQKMSRVKRWLVASSTSRLPRPRASTASLSFHARAKVTEVR